LSSVYELHFTATGPLSYPESLQSWQLLTSRLIGPLPCHYSTCPATALIRASPKVLATQEEVGVIWAFFCDRTRCPETARALSLREEKGHSLIKRGRRLDLASASLADSKVLYWLNPFALRELLGRFLDCHGLSPSFGLPRGQLHTYRQIGVQMSSRTRPMSSRADCRGCGGPNRSTRGRGSDIELNKSTFVGTFNAGNTSESIAAEKSDCRTSGRPGC